MKTCPQCGTQVPDEGQFCPSCGASVAAASAPEPEPPAPPAAPEPEPPAPPAAPEPEPPAPPAAPEPEPPASAPTPPPYAAPAYPQQYAPGAPGVQPPKKSRKGLIIAIVAVVLIALLACCGVGTFLILNSDDGTVSIGDAATGNEDQAKVEAIKTLAIGLGTLDFDSIRAASTSDVSDAITAIEEQFTEDDIAFGASTLLSSDWDGDTLLMTFEDPDGVVSYIRIYPPVDGGNELYTIDWDDTYSSEEEGIRTDFVVVDEGGWRVYSIDGETLDVFFGY